MKWISVDERLPEKKGEYLCWMADGRQPPYYPDQDQWFELVNFDGKKFDQQWDRYVTHWQAIKPPK